MSRNVLDHEINIYVCLFHALLLTTMKEADIFNSFWVSVYLLIIMKKLKRDRVMSVLTDTTTQMKHSPYPYFIRT